MKRCWLRMHCAQNKPDAVKSADSKGGLEAPGPYTVGFVSAAGGSVISPFYNTK